MTRIGSGGGWYDCLYALRRFRMSSASEPSDRAASEAGSGAAATLPPKLVPTPPLCASKPSPANVPTALLDTVIRATV